MGRRGLDEEVVRLGSKAHRPFARQVEATGNPYGAAGLAAAVAEEDPASACLVETWNHYCQLGWRGTVHSADRWEEGSCTERSTWTATGTRLDWGSSHLDATVRLAAARSTSMAMVDSSRCVDDSKDGESFDCAARTCRNLKEAGDRQAWGKTKATPTREREEVVQQLRDEKNASIYT